MNLTNNYSVLSHYYDILTNLERRITLGQKIDKIVKSIKHSNNRIVDIACGTGNLSIILSRYGYSVIGIDKSPKMLSIANQKTKEINSIQLINMEMENFQIPIKATAAVCTSFSMSYLRSIESMKVFLTSVHNSLIQDGVFILDMLHPQHICSYFSRHPFSSVNGTTIGKQLLEHSSATGNYTVKYTIKNQSESFVELHKGLAIEPNLLIDLAKHVGFKSVYSKPRTKNSHSPVYELFCYKKDIGNYQTH